MLLAGEAGVGKTRLLEAVAASSGCVVLAGRAVHGAGAPHGPVVAALRAYLRAHPGGLDECGPLRPHLALILPELGDPPAAGGDRATLFEAIRCALEHIAREHPAVLVLDDLQWSDDATLDLLLSLAEPLGQMPLLVLAGYRSDGLPRDHALRRMRHELRRAGRLDELTLGPLTAEETAALVGQVLGEEPAPSLAEAIHDRTQGLPFFVEELAGALAASGSLTAGERGPELVEGGEVPVPDTIRDAVLMSAAELSPDARAAAEAAAVAGPVFDLALVGEVASVAGLAELVERGLISEDGAGRAAFHHALTRETFYADVPWLARRALHRRLAEALEETGGESAEVATHWLGARDERRARDALLHAAEQSRAVHAHRDAARAGRQALDLWGDDDEPPLRLEALTSYANSAELAGELAEAGRSWREICALAAETGEGERRAVAQRRLAAVHEMKGDREAALAARTAAAVTFSAAGMHADAAVEHLVTAVHLTTSARQSAAIVAAVAAGTEAGLADRRDLRARALGLEGVARGRRGDTQAGLRSAQAGLSLALELGITTVVAELYQCLSVVLYNSAEYRRAEGTLDTALDLCRAEDVPALQLECEVCMIYVLRECGEWPRAVALASGPISESPAAWLAEGLIGAIYGFQGRLRSARRLLSSSLAASARADHFPLVADTTASLAWVAAAQGDDEEAARLCHALLARWEISEDHHYAVRGLRWAAGFFARRGDLEAAHACASALTRIASDTGRTEALAALAYAIGETALADGDAATAAEHLVRAVDLHGGLDIPLERADIQLRAGVALAAAGEREQALERLADAHRIARSLGARPLAAEAAREVEALGESITRRLGRRAAADTSGAGLSRRELEVLRLVAVGRTNPEIAQELVISPRTVDMHVRNLLRKLDCRSRIEAALRAGELGLVV